jgi:predicted enzyme related to lactoylglutathione lyase
MRNPVALIALLLVAWAAACPGEEAGAPHEEPAVVEHPVVFWELGCHDAETSVAFFRDLFGWDISQSANPILYNARTAGEGGGVNGAIFTLSKAKLPFLTVYVLVNDIEERARLVEELGGLVVEPPHEIQSGLWICLFNDPSGVTFAMIEQAPSEEE